MFKVLIRRYICLDQRFNRISEALKQISKEMKLSRTMYWMQRCKTLELLSQAPRHKKKALKLLLIIFYLFYSLINTKAPALDKMSVERLKDVDCASSMEQPILYISVSKYQKSTWADNKKRDCNASYKVQSNRL